MVLSVGDKIKQVKKIIGFDYVGEVFTVTNIYNGRIAFCSSRGIGFMTLEECIEYFEKIEKKEEKWSEWKPFKGDKNVKYRTKGELIEMRDFYFNNSVFSKPCKEDTFDFETGLKICRIKMEIFYHNQVLKEIVDMVNKEVGSQINELKKQLEKF